MDDTVDLDENEPIPVTLAALLERIRESVWHQKVWLTAQDKAALAWLERIVDEWGEA